MVLEESWHVVVPFTLKVTLAKQFLLIILQCGKHQKITQPRVSLIY